VDIKNDSVFAAIRDINEVLSLSNEPQKLLNMTLDTLAQVLDIECCWVQTINVRKRSLSLSAERGFTSAMQAEMASMDMNAVFTKQLVGLGDQIVIPSLSNDGLYGLSSFRSAGYKWLIAAPLLTYRVHGVLGVASRYKKRFHKETADLVMVIGGLIGNALNKADLSQQTPVSEKREQPVNKAQPKKTVVPAEQSSPPATPVDKPPAKAPDAAFPKHAHSMKSFRSLHR